MDESNPYRSDDGIARTRESVVVFLDILGYKSFIQSAYKAGTAEAALSQLRRALDKSYSFLKSTPKRMDGRRAWEARTFTDNIVIGFPIFIRKDGEAEMAIVFLV